MIYPHSPDHEIMMGFKAWLIKMHGDDLGTDLYDALTSDKGAVILLYDNKTFTKYLCCFFGSMSFCEMYKVLNPTTYKRIKNNNEDLMRKINIPGQ